jgi:hypothetical protein
MWHVDVWFENQSINLIYLHHDHTTITREIRLGSTRVAIHCTVRGHFGCTFKATAEYTTGVWWAFYVRIMST